MQELITIKDNVKEQIVEKKSKFIASVYKVESIEEAEEQIKNTKKLYFDARHNCIAYRILSNDGIIEKSSDDGEPSGTAGMPMLNILQKGNWCNVLVIVTRYFGGILLGTGGLVRAYSEATKKAMEKCEKLSILKGLVAEAVLDYQNFESFKYYCKKNEIEIKKIDYNEKINCILELENIVKEKLLEDFEKRAINIENLKFLYEKNITKSI